MTALLADMVEGPVTAQQIARVLGISVANVDLYRSAGLQPKSLNAGVKSSAKRADYQDGEEVLADILEVVDQPSPVDAVMEVRSFFLMPLLP